MYITNLPVCVFTLATARDKVGYIVNVSTHPRPQGKHVTNKLVWYTSPRY